VHSRGRLRMAGKRPRYFLGPATAIATQRRGPRRAPSRCRAPSRGVSAAFGAAGTLGRVLELVCDPERPEHGYWRLHLDGVVVERAPVEDLLEHDVLPVHAMVAGPGRPRRVAGCWRAEPTRQRSGTGRGRRSRRARGCPLTRGGRRSDAGNARRRTIRGTTSLAPKPEPRPIRYVPARVNPARWVGLMPISLPARRKFSRALSGGFAP